MKRSNHQTQGLRFIALCLVAGLIIYLVASRGANRAPDPPLTNISDAIASSDMPANAPVEPAAAEEPYASATNDSAGEEPSQSEDGREVASTAGEEPEQDQCSGSWSVQPGGEAHITLASSSGEDSVFEIRQDGRVADTGNYVAENGDIASFTSRGRQFLMVCVAGSEALLTIKNGDTVVAEDKVYFVGR